MRLPIAREGFPFILPPLAAAGLAAFFGAPWVMIVALPLAAFMLYFFRDPERSVAGSDSSLVSPADGRVVRIERTPQGRIELSIFLSPLNVHINRSPVAGTLAQAEHRPGRFLAAYKDAASTDNEQTRLLFETPWGVVRMRQIVGFLARRIVLWNKAGDQVERGQRIGLMKFGSRVDLEFSATAVLKVEQGQNVLGATTVLAELKP